MGYLILLVQWKRTWPLTCFPPVNTSNCVCLKAWTGLNYHYPRIELWSNMAFTLWFTVRDTTSCELMLQVAVQHFLHHQEVVRSTFEVSCKRKISLRLKKWLWYSDSGGIKSMRSWHVSWRKSLGSAGQDNRKHLNRSSQHNQGLSL